jgi:hypothetical protein
VVRIFNQRGEQVQIHPRQEPGKFSQPLECGGMSRPVLASCQYWIDRLGLLGEGCQQWAKQSVKSRGAQALRSLMGVWGLHRKNPAATINAACQEATATGVYGFRGLVELLGAPRPTAFDFQETHPLIRDLGVYSAFITTTTTTTYDEQNPQIHSHQTAPLGAAGQSGTPLAGS